MKYIKSYKLFENSNLLEQGYRIDSHRDEDDEGTFVIVYHPTRKTEIGNQPYPVGTLHVPDYNIRQNWEAGDVYVDSNERRKGIASWMYEEMSRILEKKPKASSNQSKDGKSLWKSLKNSQFS